MKVKTLSGIYVEVNERDSQWIKWFKEHEFTSENTLKFLELYPPPSTTVEASDLKSDKSEFKSHGGEK